VATQRSQSHVALGRAIREIRRQHGISQEKLADRIPVDRTYLGGIERGERNVAYANLLLIAKALDVRISVLVTRADELEDEDAGASAARRKETDPPQS
jgi:transcriptional regulator with XRE-family HTH domain